MEIFAEDPLVQIIGVAEIDPVAVGIKLARRLSIPITRDYRELLEMERVDLIIDVTGNPEVERVLEDFYRMGVTIIGGASAKFMWQLIEVRIRATAEIEMTLNRYQSLYRLYVKEAGAAVTEERTRIACEIHDGFVQSLVGLSFKLELCRELVDKDSQACQAALRETKEELKNAIQEARQVIFNLRPVQYDKMELIPALTNYLKSYQMQYRVKTEFTVTGDETTLFPKTKIFLFRIMQEALSNVTCHADASLVQVHLTAKDDKLHLEVIDGGRGFNLREVASRETSLGLKGMRERAILFGGTFNISSSPGKGTHVKAEFPLLAQ